MKGSFLFKWLLVMVLVAQCLLVKSTFFAKLFCKPAPKLPELHAFKMCVSSIRNTETERDVKATEIIRNLNFNGKDNFKDIEEKDATKSYHQKMEEKSATESNSRYSMQGENVTASIKMLTKDLMRNLGLPTMDEITSAWMA
jgi:hypothetical protein